jgi:drug/metabolite transporter (DMT)-like permease
MFIMDVYFTLTSDLPELPHIVRVIGPFAFIAVLWLWIWMLNDFFRLRPASSPTLWGWLLFLGIFLGSIAYFFAVWRPRNKPHDA